MIARLRVFLPRSFAVAIARPLPSMEWEDGPYRVRIMPPQIETSWHDPTFPETVTLGGEPAREANVLVIDFLKNEFDRSPGIAPPFTTHDPPIDTVIRAVAELVSRLRYVLRAPNLRTPQLPGTKWRLRYLTDAEEELALDPALVRGRSATSGAWTIAPVTPESWSLAAQLPAGFSNPVWEDLLLDAQAQLPDAGPAITLAASALEVMIAVRLNQLATADKIDQDLWSWMNDRGDYRKEPSVLEQFDQLLKALAGHSLKEVESLWIALKRLRKVRNLFAHEGVIGITTAEALELINSTRVTIDQIDAWLPEPLRSPKRDVAIEIGATAPLDPHFDSVPIFP